MDAPADDPAAVQASVQTIAQRFEASRGRHDRHRRGQWPGLAHRHGGERLLPPEAALPRADRGARLLHERGHDRHLGAGRLAPRRRLRPRPGPLRRGGHAGVRADRHRRRARGPLARRGRRRRSVQPALPGRRSRPAPTSYLMQAWLEAAGEDLNYGTFGRRHRRPRARHPRRSRDPDLRSLPRRATATPPPTSSPGTRPPRTTSPSRRVSPPALLAVRRPGGGPRGGRRRRCSGSRCSGRCCPTAPRGSRPRPRSGSPRGGRRSS